ncbi:hypothetical protein AAC03nite_11910 [Alicyclobacillus acidoterrestris]|nr:hypothetical protein AAC03nite_11910 [Alicyclobacillus acidoterrestris]
MGQFVLFYQDVNQNLTPILRVSNRNSEHSRVEMYSAQGVGDPCGVKANLARGLARGAGTQGNISALFPDL